MSEPSTTTPSARRWTWPVALAAGWTVFALLSALQTVVRIGGSQPIVWSSLLTDRFADWYTCALFTPAYFWLARRWPVTGKRWLQGALVHLAATQLFVVIKYTLYIALGIAFSNAFPDLPFTTIVATAIRRNVVYENMVFWGVAVLVHAILFYRHAVEREARAERLRAELTQARLDALSGQLHPHFLFNALNAVSSLMHHDIAAADAMLARLGDLLRRTLRAGEHPEVTLREELDLLDDYLSIVGARFRDRLVVDVSADADTACAMVPHFVLQPLVENALEHGIAQRAGAGRLEVRASREGIDGATLVLTVTDDGPGLTRSTPRARPQAGIGLANTRRRLAALYGDAHQLTLCDRPSGGLVARIELPFRAASPLVAVP
ncbi:MAG: histidine kinase internal region [Gemmatimonadetes bacterium]|nr:histidine kinase internal region [Gemmatimonadota bacterium]